MNIKIITNTQSYIPEAYAYNNFFRSFGLKSDLMNIDQKIDNNTDLLIKFMGFEPRIKKYSKNIVMIHEYTSLSTPPYAKLKDKLKFLLNSKPDGRIYLNSVIKYYFGFNNKTKYIFRDMGVDKGFFDIGKKNLESVKSKKEFDLVYCGSINQRSGLVDCLINLLKMEFKILLIGEITNDINNVLKEFKNIQITGKLKRNEIPSYYLNAKCGLNFTPNQHPFNFQTSTKTLEYCASNLGVLSSKYFWSENFIKSRFGKFLWIEDLKSKDQLYNFDFIVPKVEDLEWNYLLNNIKFINFIKSFN